MIVRRMLGVLGCGPRPDADTVEIAVLRHQLAVLRRQMARPRYTPAPLDLLPTGGRRGLDGEVVELVLRLAGENPRWGSCGSWASAEPSAYACRRRRCGGSCASTGLARHRGEASWTQFLRTQAGGLLACDFFTVASSRVLPSRPLWS